MKAAAAFLLFISLLVTNWIGCHGGGRQCQWPSTYQPPRDIDRSNSCGDEHSLILYGVKSHESSGYRSPGNYYEKDASGCYWPMACEFGTFRGDANFCGCSHCAKTKAPTFAQRLVKQFATTCFRDGKLSKSFLAVSPPGLSSTFWQFDNTTSCFRERRCKKNELFEPTSCTCIVDAKFLEMKFQKSLHSKSSRFNELLDAMLSDAKRKKSNFDTLLRDAKDAVIFDKSGFEAFVARDTGIITSNTTGFEGFVAQETGVIQTEVTAFNASLRGLLTGAIAEASALNATVVNATAIVKADLAALNATIQCIEATSGTSYDVGTCGSFSSGTTVSYHQVSGYCTMSTSTAYTSCNTMCENANSSYRIATVRSTAELVLFAAAIPASSGFYLGAYNLSTCGSWVYAAADTCLSTHAYTLLGTLGSFGLNGPCLSYFATGQFNILQCTLPSDSTMCELRL